MSMEPLEGPGPGGIFWCKCLICLKKNRGSAKQVSSSTFYLHNPKWKTKQREVAAAVQAGTILPTTNPDHAPHPPKRSRRTTKGTSQMGGQNLQHPTNNQQEQNSDFLAPGNTPENQSTEHVSEGSQTPNSPINYSQRDTSAGGGHNNNSTEPYNAQGPTGSEENAPPEPELDEFLPNELGQVIAEASIRLEDLSLARKFIVALESASFSHSGLSREEVGQLQNPSHQLHDVESDFNLRASLEFFIALNGASEATYTLVINTARRLFPSFEPLSFYQVERRLALITGITSLTHDMCPNSCIGFTGPLEAADRCPICDMLRWNPIQLERFGKKIPAKTFCTIPVGPALQALYASSESARAMKYRCEKTRATMQSYLGAQADPERVFDDLTSGDDYQRLVAEGSVNDDDILLMLSMDGAQLYEHKMSDCWIYIWVILELSPDKRYKKRHVIPGGFIPGPKKPKNIDSFLFPGLYHIACLQNEGFKVYDGDLRKTVSKFPKIILKTADGPGMACLNGLVGHNGARGCRIYCRVPSRHRDGHTHYYPVLLKPDNFTVARSDHIDVDLSSYSPYSSQEEYKKNLAYLLGSVNTKDYDQRRRLTGISKPSIFTGLNNPLGIPGCFPLDTMHLIFLNIPDLMIPLWRGLLKCDDKDSIATWDWAVLTGDVWKAHGAHVASLRPFLPTTYERPPRNPAEKINSGYKASEFGTYFYGYLPGLLINILPVPYLLNFYKLVRVVQLILQRKVTLHMLDEAENLIVDFLREFEELYVQRKEYRMHFVRQCLHTLWHLISETRRLGPPALYAQWVMERTIGNLGQEIRLHSNPYSNISQRGVLRASVNALFSKYPHLSPKSDGHDTNLPRGTLHLGNNYYLLRVPQDTKSQKMEPSEIVAYLNYASKLGYELTDSVKRCGRIRLPNGQDVRSAWKEDLRPSGLTSRMVKLGDIDSLTKAPLFGEVLFFFTLESPYQVCAMISLTDSIDPQILAASSNVLYTCTFTRYKKVEVFDVHHIEAVIALLPMLHIKHQDDAGPRYFIMEQLGLSVSQLAGSSGTWDSGED